MVTGSYPQSVTSTAPNGAAMAAALAAGIGAFAMGLFVLLNEAGLFAAPALYGPAGGVTGRTTFATVVWLGAWAQPVLAAPLLVWGWYGLAVRRWEDVAGNRAGPAAHAAKAGAD